MNETITTVFEPLSTKDKDVRIEINPYSNQPMYIFDPYNPANMEITREEVETILRTYGIDVPIFNFNLYKRAFIHQSYIKRAPPLPPTSSDSNKQPPILIAERPDNCLPLFSKSNEGLENLGDAVLELVVQTYLYTRFPKMNECPKFLTDKKIAIVNNENTGQMALDMGLNRWLILSKYAEIKGRTELSILGDLFEALIGAIYLDFSKIPIEDTGGWFSNLFMAGPGFQMAQVFIVNILERHVDWTELIQTDNNHKNILQVLVQKKFRGLTPHYMDIAVSPQPGGQKKMGPFHMGVYLCLNFPKHEAKPTDAVMVSTYESYKDILDNVEVNGGKLCVFLGESTHKKKVKAEQQAAQIAIENLQKLT